MAAVYTILNHNGSLAINKLTTLSYTICMSYVLGYYAKLSEYDKVICYLSILLFSITTISQQNTFANRTHSLDYENCDDLYSFGTQILDSSFFFNEGVLLATENIIEHPKSLECEAYPLVLTIFGFHKYVNDDILGSRSALLKADSIYKSYNEIKSKYYIRNNIFLGLNYSTNNNDSTKSLQFLRLARDVSIKINDQKLLGDALHNIGIIYANNDIIDQAKKNFDESIYYCEKSNNIEILGYCNLSLSMLLRKEQKWSQALEKINEAEAKFKILNNWRQQYLIEKAKSEVYTEMGKFDQAIEHLENAYRLGNETDQKFLHGEICFELGTLLQKSNNNKYIEYYEVAFANSNSLSDNQYSTVVNALTSHYLKTNDINKFHLMFNELLDFCSINKNLLKTELWESEKREITIQKEKAENEVLRLKNKFATRINSIILIASFICLLFAIYAYNQLIKNKKLNNQITLKNNQLENQNIELKNFAYMASHDLKAPANSISSFAGLVKMKISTLADQDTLKFVDIIEKSAKGMSQLVSSLLEFSNLENAKTEFSSFSVSMFFEQILNNLYSVIEQNDAKVKLMENLPDQIIGDETKLKTLFQNIINNAIKFVPEERLPNICIQYNQDENFHKFSIVDNGIGMEQKNIDKVFFMFQRLNASHKYSGSGIGLSTCKKIIELHKGKIEIESKINEGSTFHIYIPNDLPSKQQT